MVDDRRARAVAGLLARVVLVAALSGLTSLVAIPAASARDSATGVSQRAVERSDIALPVVGDAPCATPRLSETQSRELARLSDATTLRSLAEGRDRLERITEILLDRSDRRGVAAAFQRDVLREAAPALGAADAFRDPVWATRLTADLLRRYLAGLHASLTGGEVPAAWRSFYAMAADCDVRPGRVALAGLDAQLVLDLPESVSASGAVRSDRPDYLVLGAILQRSAARVGVTLRDAFGTDLTELLRRWAYEDQLDPVAGRGVSTGILFTTVRAVAFDLGVGLSNPWTRVPHRFALQNTHAVAERVADDLAARSLL